MLTVLTPATAPARLLLSVEAVKAELSITDPASDAVLRRYIESATARLASYANRDTFAVEEVAETFAVQRHQLRFLLTRRPVLAVSTVTVDGEAVSGWELDGRFLHRVASGVRTCWSSGVWRVTYRAGYDLPAAAPPDLADACMTLVKTAWFARSRDPLLKSQSIDGVGTDAWWIGGVAGGGGLPTDMATALYSYRYD